MSQFDHESPDQSAAANALVREFNSPDLIALTAEALHERAAYIVEHSREIGVRVKIGERWEDYPLSELRGSMAISEAFRLLMRAEVPHRKVGL